MTRAAAAPGRVGRRLAAALGAVLLAACVPDAPARTTARATYAATPTTGPCPGPLRDALNEWGAIGGGLPAPPGPTGGRALRFPSHDIGVWIVVDGSAVHRVDATGTTTRSFSAGCRVSERRTPRDAGPSGPSHFTDDDLRAALAAAAGRGVVVYAWSPHMPLSVDGWAEIDEAARAAGMTALPVLIAHADMDFAGREAARVGIPADGLRTVASVELLMRDLQVHAPAILVFGDGRASPVLPGYRNAEGYGRFLDAFLKGGG